MGEVWRLPQSNNVTDARTLKSGLVLVAEQNYFRVAQWDPITGRDFNPRNTQTQPVVAAPTADGGVLVVCRGSVSEFDAKGAAAFPEYARPTADIQSGAKLPNGETVFVTLQQQPNAPNCFRLDRKGKPVGTPVTLGPIHNAHAMDVVGDDHVLVCEPGQAAEYDLKTGKLVWEYKVNNPTSAQRLPNGNTLVAALNENRAVEVLPTGEAVWEYAAKDRLKVSRIYHR
ncbi:MAG: PQQ-like beta-propeller repeat protein [Gemmataceae bacterium]|nr:PQQ-like beta-propeller repeat protein [Gemmataceae bacterium]